VPPPNPFTTARDAEAATAALLCELGGGDRSCGYLVCPARAHRSCFRCSLWTRRAAYRGGALPWSRPNVPDSPEVLHCTVRLERGRSSVSLFRRAVVMQNEDLRPFITHSCTAPLRNGKSGERRTCLRRWADLLAILLPACRGVLYCAVTRGGRSGALRLCLPSVPGSRRGGAAARRRGGAALKYAAPCCSRRWAASAPAL